MLKTMTKKTIPLLLFIINATISCGFANNNLEGTYCKTDGATKIYLKIKSIKDSVYYFELKDYDTTKDNYKQRNIIGTLLCVNGKLKLNNADFYLSNYFFDFTIKNESRLIKVGSNRFRMYYTFDDIKGDYVKVSNTVDVNYKEFQPSYYRKNDTYTAKQKIEISLFDFPNTWSALSKIIVIKSEKIYEIKTVGTVYENKPLTPQIIRFSLIEIPRLKIRKWVNTDELEDKFK